MRELFKAYFIYTRRERRGIFVLLFVIAAVNLLPFLYRYLLPEAVQDISEFEADIIAFEQSIRAAQIRDSLQKDSVQQLWAARDVAKPSGKKLKVNTAPFFFDPNTAALEELTSAGISNQAARTIVNFRNKGGRFYSKKDLKKIYGLSNAEYLQIEPWVRIAQNRDRSGSASGKVKSPKVDQQVKPTVELNTSDTLTWMELKGIGPVYAHRIIKYRDLLGGYIGKAQLKEVYGIDDTLYQEIEDQVVDSPFMIQKINVNSSNVKQLSRHPYCDYKTAQAIVKYQNQHGPYDSIQELKKIRSLPEAKYLKLLPYLTVEEEN